MFIVTHWLIAMNKFFFFFFFLINCILFICILCWCFGGWLSNIALFLVSFDCPMLTFESPPVFCPCFSLNSTRAKSKVKVKRVNHAHARVCGPLTDFSHSLFLIRDISTQLYKDLSLNGAYRLGKCVLSSGPNISELSFALINSLHRNFCRFVKMLYRTLVLVLM